VLAVVLLVASLAVVWAIAPLIAVAAEIFLLVLFRRSLCRPPPHACFVDRRGGSQSCARSGSTRRSAGAGRCLSCAGSMRRSTAYNTSSPRAATSWKAWRSSVPSTGTAWLSVRDDGGPSSETPVLIRLAQDPLRATEEPTGYL
jgi:hypothetical protein